MVPLLSATFTGAAGTLLSAYTPETGEWVIGAGDFSSLKLDGAGNLEWPVGAAAPASPVAFSTTPGIGTDYTKEAVLTLNPVAAAPVGAEAGVSIAFYVRPNPYGSGGAATDNYAKATFTFIAGGVLRTTVEYRYNGTVFPVSGSTVNSSAYPNADHTFTLKAVLDGKYLILYVDGSQIVLRDLFALNAVFAQSEGDVRIEANLAGVAAYHGAKLGSLLLTGTLGPEMFLDELIGSGNMVAHVPEVGNWNPTGMVDNTLTGSGQLRWGPSTRGEANLLGPRRPIVLEAVITPTAIPVPPTYDMFFEMYLVAYLAPSPNFNLRLGWDTAAPSGWKTICNYWDGVSTHIIDNLTAAASIALGTPYTFRIEVGDDAVDPGVRFFMNGALLASSAIPPVGAINRLGFRAETHAGTGIGAGTVDYFKAVSRGNPPPEPPLVPRHYLYMTFDDLDEAFPPGTWFQNYYPEEGLLDAIALIFDFDDGSHWYTGPINSAETAAPQRGNFDDLVWDESAGHSLPMFFSAADWIASTKDYWVVIEVTLNPVDEGSGFAFASFFRPNGGSGSGTSASPFMPNSVLAEFAFSGGVLTCTASYQLDGGSASEIVYESSVYPNADRRFHLRAEMAGDELRFYVDGVMVGTKDVTEFDPIFANESSSNRKYVAFDFARANAPDGVSLNYILIADGPYDGPPPVPPEPAFFWTAKVNAIEDTVP